MKLACFCPRWPGPLQHHVRAAGGDHQPGLLHRRDAGSTPGHRPQGQGSGFPQWRGGSRLSVSEEGPLSCSLAVPCSVPSGGPVPPFETSSCPIASDPSFQAQARCHCLRRACLHHGLEVTPPLDWLPRGLSVSPLLLAPVLLLRCLESFRAGPGAHSSFLGWFLFSVETEGVSAQQAWCPGVALPKHRLWLQPPGSGHPAGKWRNCRKD